MKLLQELNEEIEYIVEESAPLTEGAEPKKNHYLTGIYMQEDTQNRNGRIYPASVLDSELKRYQENYIDQNRAYGELNHPSEPTINLDKVSHRIVEMKKSGKDWIGKAKINENPNGMIVRGLIEDGGRLGVSSRGLGSIKVKNGVKIVESLMLTTAADIVADPSVSSAFVDRIMESPEWFFNGVDWVQQEKAMEIISEQKQFTREQREASFLSMFDRFVKTLNGE